MAAYSKKERKEIDQAIRHLQAYVFERNVEATDAFEVLMEEIMEMVAELFNRDDIENVAHEVMRLPSYDSLFAYVFEEIVNWNEEESTLNQYLQQRGWREGPNGKKYLRALSKSRVRLWEVMDVSEGEWLDVRRFGTVSAAKRVFDEGAAERSCQVTCLPGG